MPDIPVEVKVWGEWACFTRPELHVERVSYPVITPSAARGVLEMVFWKPEFRWMIREIVVLKPISYFSILRNEITKRQTERTARGWKDGDGFYASDNDNRAQRNTLALRDVAYIIRADVVVKPGIDEHPAKFRDQFRRRVARGQCYAQPYLGCREFTAWFGEPGPSDVPKEPISMTVGRMLHDLEFAPGPSGSAIPRFFNARIEDSVMRVPLWEGGNHAS